MQCSCPHCGILMGHCVQGIHSTCKCPACLSECAACLGTNCVLTPDKLRALYERISREEEPS